MGEAKNHVWYDGYYATHQKNGGEYMKKPEDTYYYPVWKRALAWIGKANVIDLGCGPGQFGLCCMRKGLVYQGYDFSPKAIEMAGEMTGHPEFFHVADITKGVPITYDKHSVVVTLETLEHINDDLAILKSIPKGMRVIFSVPSFDYKSHVRFFKNIVEAKRRYKPLVNITRTRAINTKDDNYIFLIEGVIK